MGIFGGRGNAPDGMAGLGARLGQQLRNGGRGRPQAGPRPGGRRPRQRGNAPDGMAGLGARLGQRMRGYDPGPTRRQASGCGCGGCGRSGLYLMGLTGLVSSLLGVQKVAPPASGSAASKLATRLVRSYQDNVAAHRDGTPCVYTPTCSDYALEAMERHGAVKGSALAGARIARCTPRRGGYDPVR